MFFSGHWTDMVSVLAFSAVLVMLRQTVSGWVYFWVSDSVSMAADASDRKALRYKQTLVSVLLLFLLFCVCLWLCLSSCICPLVSLPHLFLCCVLTVLSLMPFLNDAPVLAVQAACVRTGLSNLLCVCVCESETL